MYNAYYEGSNDSYISFTQGFKENVDIHVTYDGTGKKKIQVNGKDVYIVKDKNITSCYYEDKGCIISLSSTEKESEFIKILKKYKIKCHTWTPLVVSYVDTIGGGFLVKNGIYRNEFVFR